MRWMGAISEDTLVVTTVHDLQLVDDIEESQMLEHDVPVDIIVTPTQVRLVSPSVQQAAYPVNTLILYPNEAPF